VTAIGVPPVPVTRRINAVRGRAPRRSTAPTAGLPRAPRHWTLAVSPPPSPVPLPSRPRRTPSALLPRRLGAAAAAAGTAALSSSVVPGPRPAATECCGDTRHQWTRGSRVPAWLRQPSPFKHRHRHICRSAHGRHAAPHLPAPPPTTHYALSTVLGPAATSTAAASQGPAAAAGHEGGRRPPRPRGRRRAPRAVGGSLRDGDAHPPSCHRRRRGRVPPGRAAAPEVVSPTWLLMSVAQATTRRRSHHGCLPTTLLAAPQTNDVGRRRQKGGRLRVGRRVGQRQHQAALASRRGPRV